MATKRTENAPPEARRQWWKRKKKCPQRKEVTQSISIMVLHSDDGRTEKGRRKEKCQKSIDDVLTPLRLWLWWWWHGAAPPQSESICKTERETERRSPRLDPIALPPSRWRPVETGKRVEVIDFSLFWAVGAGCGRRRRIGIRSKAVSVRLFSFLLRA